MRRQCVSGSLFFPAPIKPKRELGYDVAYIFAMCAILFKQILWAPRSYVLFLVSHVTSGQIFVSKIWLVGGITNIMNTNNVC